MNPNSVRNIGPFKVFAKTGEKVTNQMRSLVYIHEELLLLLDYLNVSSK